MSIAAIVVARGGSVRLPRKNLLEFVGETLIAHKISQLKSVAEVSAVYVNTDDAEIRQSAVGAGAIPLAGKDYGGDANWMIEDSCRQVGEDVVLWAHPTNPLVRPSTYSRAIADFTERQRMPHMLRHDSLVSVMPMRRHAWFAGSPLNHRPWSGHHEVSADLKPVLFQDGAIFIQPRAKMVANRNFYGVSPWLFEMPPMESVDIDTEQDYVTAKALYAQYFTL